MPNTLLLTIDEVADNLRISTRTVQRMIQAGLLPSVPIGRNIRIRRCDLITYVDKLVSYKHNLNCVGPSVLEEEKQACHTNVKKAPSGGCLLPGQTAKELDALLAQPIERKRKPLRLSGNSKRTASANGKLNHQDCSTN